MGSLLTTIIGIIFCALLLVAGANYLQPKAFIEHTLADTNDSQIESLVADYNNLAMANGHRPSSADYAAVYGSGSANIKYLNNGGTITTDATMAYKGANGQLQPVGKWQFIAAGCGVGNTQDCFCLPITSATDVTFNATHMSALKQMDSTSQSRVQFSTNGCTDQNPTTDPGQWGANPINYFLIVMLNNASGNNPSPPSNPSSPSNPSPPSCTPSGTPTASNPSCLRGCGSSTAISWSCTDSCGNSLPQGSCSAPSCPASYADCVATPQYGLCDCTSSTKPYIGYTCTGDGNTVASNYCTAPSNAPQPCTPTGCAPVGSWTASSCSATCGAGSITYTCIGGTCTTPQPASTSCEGTTTCQWTPTNGTCSCSGTQTISYACTKSDGATAVSSADCTGAQGPASQSCTPPNTCYTGSWQPQTTCTPGCGTTSTAITTYVCSGGTCNPATQPAPTQTSCADYSQCSYTAGCGTYSACPTTCGTGTQNLASWSCTRSDGSSYACTMDANNVTYTCVGAGASFTSTSNPGQCAPTSPATQPCSTNSGCWQDPGYPPYGSPTEPFDCEYVGGGVNPAAACNGPPGWCGERSQGYEQIFQADGAFFKDYGYDPPYTNGTLDCSYQQTDYVQPLVSVGACSNTCGQGTQSVTLTGCTTAKGTIDAQTCLQYAESGGSYTNGQTIVVISGGDGEGAGPGNNGMQGSPQPTLIQWYPQVFLPPSIVPCADYSGCTPAQALCVGP